MEKFEIPNLDDPLENYLTRWRIIQTPWFGIYLHRMDGPDSRPTLHDHPWNFLSIVLKGGYEEKYDYMKAIRYITRTNRKKATDVHYIKRLLRVPTWTLMFVGRRKREWGYVDPGGLWTQYDQHPHNDEFVEAMRIRAERKSV